MIKNDHLRRQVEELLGSPVTDPVWSYLETERYIEEVISGVMTLKELVAHVRKMQRIFGDRTDSAESTPRAHRTLAPVDKVAKVIDSLIRQEALSHLVANRAASESDVKAFRARLLDNHLLHPEQVAEWVEDHAAREGPATLWIREIALPRAGDAGVEFDGHGLRIRREIVIPHATANIGAHLLTYHATIPPHLRRIPTATGGVLEDLRYLSVTLAGWYLWSEGQATTFVLTGRSPYIEDFRATFDRGAPPSTSRISLQVDPTLSPREVAERYRTVREQVVGQRHRDLSRKHLLLAFVAGMRPQTVTWAQAMEEWNAQMGAEHPDWRYTQVTNFARDGKHAFRRLLAPEYLTPNTEGEVETNGKTRSE